MEVLQDDDRLVKAGREIATLVAATDEAGGSDNNEASLDAYNSKWNLPPRVRSSRAHHPDGIIAVAPQLSIGSCLAMRYWAPTTQHACPPPTMVSPQHSSSPGQKRVTWHASHREWQHTMSPLGSTLGRLQAACALRIRTIIVGRRRTPVPHWHNM